jgi:hypothetical protein
MQNAFITSLSYSWPFLLHLKFKTNECNIVRWMNVCILIRHVFLRNVLKTNCCFATIHIWIPPLSSLTHKIPFGKKKKKIPNVFSQFCSKVDYVNLKVSYGGLKFSSQWNFFYGIVKIMKLMKILKQNGFFPLLQDET